MQKKNQWEIIPKTTSPCQQCNRNQTDMFDNQALEFLLGLMEDSENQHRGWREGNKHGPISNMLQKRYLQWEERKTDGFLVQSGL